MGLERIGEEGDFVRFRSSADIGNVIDLKLTTIGRGQMGVGQYTILHGGLMMTKINWIGKSMWQEMDMV